MKKLSLYLLFTLTIRATAMCQTTSPAPTISSNSKATILRGPYLQVATPNEMTIRWRTNTAEQSTVRYGLTPDNLDMKANNSLVVTEHMVRLSDLKPLTKYYYSVGSFEFSLKVDKNNYFYTLPKKGSDSLVRIAGFGDCGNNSINQRNVRDQVIKYVGNNVLNAWILMGDNAYTDGTDAEFQAKFFNVYQDNLLKNYPLFPVPGNHDYNNIASVATAEQFKLAYFQNFSVPTEGEAGGVPSHTKSYYSYDIGNTHFLALDSYGPDNKGAYMYDQAGEQAEWVRKDLKANNNKWVVAYFHHPPYTMGSHNSDTEQLLVRIRENFIKILEDNGVDLVLCGHSHVYERSKLMKGYYGNEAEFDPQKFDLSSSSALYNGSKDSAPYLKSKSKTDGTVYVVAGSAGALGGHKPTWPHNAMYYYNCDIGGAIMLEVQGSRLDLKWICADGQIRDHFTMMKDVSKKDEEYLKQDKILIKK
ncbi:metallophosphoesterase family protein [Mucilaginibacter terrae]|nr:metallophosphoesterase family protein [Mucilaginibacter terrae]